MAARELTVCITAITRPAVLALTLRSFARRCFRYYDSLRIIANVDPLGSDTASRDDVVRLLNTYDSRGQARVNTPETGGFARAVRWVWNEVDAPYFLHLEDDWFLNRPINVDRVSRMLLGGEADILRLYLRRYSPSPSTGEFSLNPFFMTSAAAHDLASRMNDQADPEKQIRGLFFGGAANLPRIAFHGQAGDPADVIDIGTLWRKSHNLRKSYIAADDGSGSLSVWQKTTATSLRSRLSDLSYAARFNLSMLRYRMRLLGN
ncbi:hypothetical protein [Pleomorphomonas sp. NRK KF1]|uniref:hypothetical protein n=1 Tax=Pleomorphomonas sp. NRK KF1 TaxID=2943000 RepID=UPI00204495F8|nr:hypothetical protein [Pleomorphomonas sp. NRK KF1]MCM5555152.1 hypothetical protein [Pleomorphomonas sp. NRK KF1]